MTVDFNSWLTDPTAVRCILVDANVKSGGSEITRYLSTMHYVNGSTVYHAIVNSQSVQIIERLNLGGSSSISFGDVELINLDGAIDSWLEDIWSNREIVVKIGDVRWAISDFVTILNGVIEDSDSKGSDTINLKIRDKLQRLNNAMSETTLGGSTLNSTELIPLTFGECFNVTPLLTNPATLEYQIHRNAIEDIIEVRDNGIPVGVTKSLSTGKFTLSAAPAGKVTASIQGDKAPSYINTVGAVIQRIVAGFGGTQALSSGDIDLANFSAFDAANPQPIGAYFQTRENVITAVETVADSVGAQVTMSRGGLLRIIKISLPAAGTVFDIDGDDIIANSFQITEKHEVTGSYKLGYCRNWTVQADLQTGIPASHKDLYAQEWLASHASDATVKTDYRLTAEPELVESLLLVKTDADTECTRRLDLYKTPRFTVEFEGTARLIQLELGQAVNVDYPRFGFSGGKEGMVIGLSIDWAAMRVKVEVLV